MLEKKIQELTQDNERLRNRISYAETYSKKVNLKFFNIPEQPNETTDVLMNKLAEVFHLMNLDLNKFHIDNIHRLLSNMSGPKPVIVKFVSYLDKTRVWSRKHLLGHSNSKIYIQEHYSAQYSIFGNYC